MSRQNITRDTEIKNKLTVTRGERGGGNRGNGERSFRNIYKGYMDKAKGGKIEDGRWGWLGWKKKQKKKEKLRSF